MLDAMLPILESYDIEITKAELSHEALGFQVRFPRIQGEVTKGDVVQSGFYLGNSEVGLHRLIAAMNAFRLVCTNGMVRMENQHSIGRVHLGGKHVRLRRPEAIRSSCSSHDREYRKSNSGI